MRKDTSQLLLIQFGYTIQYTKRNISKTFMWMKFELIQQYNKINNDQKS